MKMKATSKNKTSNKTKKFLVKRDGFKVSENLYSTPDQAKDEFEYWLNLTTKWDSRSVVEVAEE
jgi:hypothetical protein